MKTSQKRSVLKYILVIAVAFMLGAATHQAEATQQTCEDNMAQSPASSYCSGLTLVYVGDADTAGYYSTSIGKCVSTGSCSITANVGTTSTTWSVANGVAANPDDFDDLDICFALNSDSTAYTATLKIGCATGDTTSSSATTDGLTAPSGASGS